MAYDWKFNRCSNSDEKAKILLKNIISEETSEWYYDTHHKGYVAFLNKIKPGFENADRETANGDYSDSGELKRRFTWNHGGALMHDIYWEVLGGAGDASKGPEVLEAIEENFGSFDNWKKDFKATAFSPRLSGWAALVFDQLYSRRLLNILTNLNWERINMHYKRFIGVANKMQTTS